MRSSNRPVAILVGLVSSIIVMTSCFRSETDAQQASDERIRHLTDSLADAGKHGFHVAYFLIGRFKTSQVKDIMFEVSVSKMDDRLLERPIRFRVLDALTYELSYSLNDKKVLVIGEFDRDLETVLFQMLVARPNFRDSTVLHRMMTDVSNFEHEIKVYRY